MERTDNPMDIQNTLMSPPEATPHESFSQPQSDTKMKDAYSMPTGRFQHPLSPPVSPETKNGPRNDPLTTVIRDPILFPTSDTNSRSPSQPPLFPIEDVQQAVHEHIKATPPSFFANTSRPRNEDYALVYEMKANNVSLYAKNPRLYAIRERNFLREDDMARRLAAPVQAITPRKYHTIAPASGSGRPTTKNGPRGGARASGPRGNGTGAIVKPYRKPKTTPTVGRASTPAPKRQAHNDIDFASLPDYSPPVESLPNKHHSLNVEWRTSSPRDLRNDPNLHHLHPDEVQLASKLRLDCAQYLTSKRRIFMRRVDFLKLGNPFRKTHAQAACNIDVNKASKLWEAFTKVGWFDEKWVAPYV